MLTALKSLAPARIRIALCIQISFLVLGPALWGQETINPEPVRDWQVSGKAFNFVDVRSAIEFQKKHIEGAVNIPRSRIMNANLPKKSTIVLYCTGEGCSVSKATGDELVHNGFKKVFVLSGGLAEWEARGFPVVAAKAADAKLTSPAGRVSPRDLSKRLKKGAALVIDVRPTAEFSAGHVPGAVNIPLESLESRIGQLDKTRSIVAYDRLPERSQKAGALLLQHGFKAQELAGGIAVWIAMKLPVEM